MENQSERVAKNVAAITHQLVTYSWLHHRGPLPYEVFGSLPKFWDFAAMAGRIFSNHDPGGPGWLEAVQKYSEQIGIVVEKEARRPNQVELNEMARSLVESREATMF